MRIHCLIDNAVSRQSAYWGEHGLAFLIEYAGKTFLFDTGGSGEVLAHNLAIAGVAPEALDFVLISHSHRDHTGGLEWLLGAAPQLRVYAHPAALERHYSNRSGEMREKGLPFAFSAAQKTRLHLSTERRELLPGVFASGEIQPRPFPEGRSPHHFTRTEAGWIPDPYADDQSLVLAGEDGLVLVCGCCHTGLANTVAWVEREFDATPDVIVGGMHLAGADEAQIDALVADLQGRGRPLLYPNHCTGERAIMALSQAFPGRVETFPAGSSLTLP